MAASLPLPVTVFIPNRGQGELNINGVQFNGRPGATVAWDGGQPLPLSGTGTIGLGAVTMDANAAGITWHLDGAPRALGPGQYEAHSSVAVGTAGLAQPLDQASFSVAPGTAAQLVSVGDAQILVAPQHELLTGPGVVQLLGVLTVQTAGGTRTATNLHAGPGGFEVELQPDAGHYDVHAVVEGPLSFP
jgi:hypothetical protein